MVSHFLGFPTVRFDILPSNVWQLHVYRAPDCSIFRIIVWGSSHPKHCKQAVYTGVDLDGVWTAAPIPLYVRREVDRVYKLLETDAEFRNGIDQLLPRRK